jgi:hypothetical protein
MTSMRSKVVIALAALALVAAATCLVRADVATPRARWTMVRMESETVGITLGEKRVAVEAVFNMYNEGKAGPVRMGYPLGLFETELHDFAVTVDGKAVEGIRTENGTPEAEGPMARMRPGGEAGAESYRFEGPYKQWKVWDLPMESRAAKTLKVTYWVEPARIKTAETGDLLYYCYTLRTGATWKGKIEQAVITVKLDGVEPARLQRVVPAGAVSAAEGKTLTWTMRQFKPADNIEIAFKPSGPLQAASLPPARQP